MDKTVWKDRGKKWKARNKQAALIFTKAKPFHLPIASPVFRETSAQKIEREARERRERIAEHERIAAIKKAEREAKEAKNKKENWAKRMKRFDKKQKAAYDRVAQKIVQKLTKKGYLK